MVRLMHWAMLMILTCCIALNMMPWAADADDAHVHGVECHAWVADAGDAHVRCVACDALRG